MEEPQNNSRSPVVPRSRARLWIIEAFNRIVLRKPYRAIGVSEISRRAGVGRSTFYEHFGDKDGVLHAALTPVLMPLALAAVGKGENRRICETLKHLREHRQRTLAMLDGAMRVQIEHALAALIRDQIDNRDPREQRRIEWVTAGDAAAMLGVIHAWLAQATDASEDQQVAADLLRIGRVSAR